MDNNFRKTNIDNIQYDSVVTQKNLLATVFAWMFAGMVITTATSLFCLFS